MLEATRADVRHVGEVPGRDLAALYDLATVFVYPSLLEGFGMPVLEAMAQGTAVVTSAGTATSEVGGAAALLVEPTDADAIAAGLDRLLADTDLRRSLEQAGRARAEAMTWDRTAAATVGAYADAIS